MKRVQIFACMALVLTVMGCAGTDADLEEARYLLGKGGKENATKAKALVDSLRTSAGGANKLEAYRLYAGAQLQIAGFDSIKIIANIIYKDSSNTDTVKTLKSALTDLNPDQAETKALVADAINNLMTVIGLAEFAEASVRVQRQFHFQLGLARTLDALRIAVQQSGLQEDGFSVSTCQSDVGADATTAYGDLKEAELGYINDAALTSDNPLVKLVTDFKNKLDGDGSGTTDAVEFCNYVNSQQ